MFLLQVATVSLAAYVVPAIIAAVGSAVAVGVTNYVNKRNNEQMLDYNRSMTQQAWERDDQYFRRSVADAEAAGLSPLAINGSMPNSAPLGAPAQTPYQAPQMDINSLLQSVLGKETLEETKRSNVTKEGFQATQLQNQAKEIQAKFAQIDLEDRKLKATVEYQNELVSLQADQLAEMQKKNKSDADFRKLSYLSEQYERETRSATGGKDVPTQHFYIGEEEKYAAALIAYQDKRLANLQQIPNTSETKMNASNEGFGANLGANIAGAPIGGNVGANYNNGSTDMESSTKSQYVQYMIDGFDLVEPLPVFHNFKRPSEPKDY